MATGYHYSYFNLPSFTDGLPDFGVLRMKGAKVEILYARGRGKIQLLRWDYWSPPEGHEVAKFSLIDAREYTKFENDEEAKVTAEAVLAKAV
jgi:hypothetical protein